MSERSDYISDTPVYVEPMGGRRVSEKRELPSPDEATARLAIEGLQRVAALNPIVSAERLYESWFGGDRRMAPPPNRYPEIAA
jgi:hypothetical protein